MRGYGFRTILSALLGVTTLNFAACVYDYPVSRKIGLISNSDYPDNLRVIAEVAGESCSSQPGLSDYRLAFQDALAKVAEANVLVDVSFYSEGRTHGLLNGEVCRIVVGKASALGASIPPPKNITSLCPKDGCLKKASLFSTRRYDGTFKMASDRIVPDRYAKIFDSSVEGRACGRLTKKDKSNFIRNAFDDAMSRAPAGADALIMATVDFKEADDGACFVINGMPVRMK